MQDLTPFSADFPFLSNVQWVDFRDPKAYRKAFYHLLCGLEDKPPGPEREVEEPLEIPGAEPVPPLPSGIDAFLDEICEALYQSPILLLLAQADMAWGSVTQSLLERARNRFGPDNTLHLAPPYSPETDTADYFDLLGLQCGLPDEVNSAIRFQAALHGRLSTGKELFLLVTGFENGSDNGRRELAGILRNLYELFPATLRVIICGGEKLADLKYAEGNLSLLNHVKVRNWPEISLADIHNLQRQWFPEMSLSNQDAQAVLRASGGHPRLVRYCLELRQRTESLEVEDYREALVESPIVWELFTPLVRDQAVAEQLCAWLGERDLGPVRPYLFDTLLRRLYWKNLLARRPVNSRERLCWRCEALREAGKEILWCQ